MLKSKSQIEWENKLRLEGGELCENLKVCYRVIRDLFAEEEENLNEDGLSNEHYRIYELINRLDKYGNVELSERDRMLVTRYSETAYLVWALYFKLKKKDILKNSFNQWFTGKDFNGTSHFRNFEFECSIALRFIEEGIPIDMIIGQGKPDYLIRNNFYVECKRTTQFFGILTNLVKARKQLNDLCQPGVVVINLDYLYNEITDVRGIMDQYEFLLICSKICEYSFGKECSNLIGVVIEFLDEHSINEQGSYAIGIRNSNLKINISSNDLESVWGTISLAICGDYKLEVYDEIVDWNRRFENDNITNIENYYNTIVMDDIKNTLLTLSISDEKINRIIGCIKKS